MSDWDSEQRIETSLGSAIERRGSLWHLNLADLPIFHGTPVWYRLPIEMSQRGDR